MHVLNWNIFEANFMLMQYLDKNRKNLHFTSFQMQFSDLKLHIQLKKKYVNSLCCSWRGTPCTKLMLQMYKKKYPKWSLEPSLFLLLASKNRGGCANYREGAKYREYGIPFSMIISGTFPSSHSDLSLRHFTPVSVSPWSSGLGAISGTFPVPPFCSGGHFWWQRFPDPRPWPSTPPSNSWRCEPASKQARLSELWRCGNEYLVVN